MLAAKRLNLPSVPCVRISHLTVSGTTVVASGFEFNCNEKGCWAFDGVVASLARRGTVLNPEETQDSSEVAACLRYCTMSIKPQCEPHGPPFHHTASKSSGELWMMRGMATVT